MAIRTGLIGYGLAGRAFHAPLVAATAGLTLTAVATSRGDAVRAALPGVAVVADPAALIDDPAIDLVILATPNDSHAPLAQAALAAGKHVVVDKPFVADLADAAPLIALARERGRVLSVFHNRRWDADFLTVHRLVRDGVLGEVMLAELRWDRMRAAIKPGWREQPGAAAGLLADLGPHLVDQALQLFGLPDRITADLAAQRPAALVDDYFEITLHYAARRVIVSASTLVASPRPRFALHGTLASFVKSGIDPQEEVLRAGGSPADAGYGVEAATAYGTLVTADGVSRSVASERGDWRSYYRVLASAIAGEGPVPVTAEDALAGLRVIDLARRSAAAGRTLDLD